MKFPTKFFQDHTVYDFEHPLIPEHDSENLEDLHILFRRGYEDVPFTSAEEEML